MEWTKLVFDYYKHLATLSGVGAAVMLTVYQQGLLDKESSGGALVLFGLGVFFCATGMWRLLVFFPLSPGTGQTTDLPLLAVLAGSVFTQAVGLAVGSALDFPIWLMIVVGVILIVAFAWALTGRNVLGYGLPRS